LNRSYQRTSCPPGRSGWWQQGAAVVAVALANKMARVAWSVLARGRGFEASNLQVV